MEKRTLKKMEQPKKLSRPSYSDDSEMEDEKMESMESMESMKWKQ